MEFDTATLLSELDNYIYDPVFIDHWSYYLRKVASYAPDLLATIVDRTFKEARLDMQIITLWTLLQLARSHPSHGCYIVPLLTRKDFIYDALNKQLNIFLSYKEKFLIQNCVEQAKSLIRLIGLPEYQEYILLSPFGTAILAPYFKNHTQNECENILNVNMSKVFLGWSRRIPDCEQEAMWLTHFQLGGYLCAENNEPHKDNDEIPLLFH